VFPALVLAAATAAGTSTAAERWLAVSNTATSITGDVRFGSSQVLFDNGKSISIRYLGTRSLGKGTSGAPAGNAERYRVYRVSTRTNPVLLNGNRLCDKAPTYMAVAHSPDSPPPGVTVLVDYYTGTAPPDRWDASAGLCASYTYSLKR
jgi:hypothetical protein